MIPSLISVHEQGVVKCEILAQVLSQRTKAKLNTEFLKMKCSLTSHFGTCESITSCGFATPRATVNNGPQLCLKGELGCCAQRPLTNFTIHVAETTNSSLDLNFPGACLSGQKEKERARIDTGGKANDSSNLGPRGVGLW